MRASIVPSFRHAGFAVAVLAGASSCADGPTPPVPPASETVLVGSGDIARCPPTGAAVTSTLLDGIAGTVFTAGDNAYEDGTATQYAQCYGPTWGRHKARTRPAPGNHEYHSPGAAPYYAYFGEAAGPPGRGYYSYDLGAWHVLSLNSNVAADAGSAQVAWLRAELAANRTLCAVAYWHHPVFSSGDHGNNQKMAEVWRVLDSAGVELVLVGHDHNYERFAPQTPSGQASTTGIREFVVGTGGANQRPFEETQPNSEKRMTGTWGALKLTLESGSYRWEFLRASGPAFSDAGASTCH